MAGQEASYWYLLTGEEWPLDRCMPITTMVPICEGDAVDITVRSDVAVHNIRVRVREIAHQQIIHKEGPVDAGCHIFCSVEVHDAVEPEKCCRSCSDIAVTEYFLGPGPQREPPPTGPKRPGLRLVE